MKDHFVGDDVRKLICFPEKLETPCIVSHERKPTQMKGES